MSRGAAMTAAGGALMYAGLLVLLLAIVLGSSRPASTRGWRR